MIRLNVKPNDDQTRMGQGKVMARLNRDNDEDGPEMSSEEPTLHAAAKSPYKRPGGAINPGEENCPERPISYSTKNEESIPHQKALNRSPLKQTLDIANRSAPRTQRRLGAAVAGSLLVRTEKLNGSKGLGSPVKSLKFPESDEKVRSSPQRKAKSATRYEMDFDSEEDPDVVNADDSEWHGSTGSTSEDEDFEDDDATETSARTGPEVSRLKLPLRIEAQLHSYANPQPLQVIDLTGSSDTELTSRPKQSRALPLKHDVELSSSDYSDVEPFATIRFSPSQYKSPTKIRPERRLITPPQSPSKSKLTSPKKGGLIPQTPHRPSLDGFWNQDLINTWNDQHSPSKTLKSLKKIPPRVVIDSESENDDSLVPHGSPTRKHQTTSSVKSPEKWRDEKQKRKAFEAKKCSIAIEFLEELDTKISSGEIDKLASSTGGVKIVWSKKLNSTAGRANWRREAVRTHDADGVLKSTAYRHIASIELAEKVIDDEHRLLNVLAHEYCHLVNFMISNVKDQPHGASFQQWAAKITSEFGHRGVNVTTKHSYAISYKYAWACVNADSCGIEYERHSKSIDPKKHSCGKCKAKLVQIRPVPRRVKDAGNVGDGKPENKNAYQTFVKEHFGAVKQELGPRSPMKDVMKELGARYRLEKESQASPAKEKRASSELADASRSDGGASGVFEDNDDASMEQVARKLDFLTL